MRVGLAVLLTALVAAAPAAAQGLEIARVTTGPLGGNAPAYTELLLVSADGTRAVFASDEQLTEDDRRPYFDFYDRVGDITRLLGQDAGLDDPKHSMPLYGASADATRIVFSGAGRWTADDTDDHHTFDTYAARNGVVERISLGPTGGNEDYMDATPAGISGDGNRILFETAENLTADDTDYKKTDVFMREGSTTTRISTGPGGGNHQDSSGATVAGHSADARVVILRTSEALSGADDTDGQFDLFAREGTTTTKVSPGNGAHEAVFDAVSDDGRVVVLHTTERLTPDDTDDRSDAYRVAGGAVSRVSTGPNGGNDNAHNVGYELSRLGGDVLYVTPDGARVVFSSYERLTPDDTDAQVDSYLWDGGAVTRVSTGPNGGNGEYDRFGWNLSGLVAGGADDASSLVFVSRERITPDDTDDRSDLFERSGGVTRRVTTGPSGGNADVDIVCPWPPRDGYCGSLRHVSGDGARIFFETRERLVGADTDDLMDVYMRAGGVTTLLSPARPGRLRDAPVFFTDGGLDGALVYLQTEEQLTADDTDDTQDGFRVRTPEPGAITPGVSGADGGGPAGSGGGGDPGSGGPGTTGSAAGPRLTLLGRPRALRRAPGRVRLARSGRGLPFRVAGDATVTVILERVLRGRRHRAQCVRPAPRLRRRPSCRRVVAVARPKRFEVPAGRHVLRVGRRGVRPGLHRITLFTDPRRPQRVTLRLR